MSETQGTQLAVREETAITKQVGNRIFPTQHMQRIGPCQVLRVSEVRINPDPEAGEVWCPSFGKDKRDPKKPQKFALTKNALLNLSKAAGIKWLDDKCHIVTIDRDHVIYEAVAAVRDPDGEWTRFKASKEIDLAWPDGADTAEIIRICGSEQAAKAMWRQQRQHRLSLAETKAMLRVVRGILSLKQLYTLEELKQPFLIPHIDFSPDMNDPATRAQAMLLGQMQSAALYGTPAPALPEPKAAEYVLEDEEEPVEEAAEVVEAEPPDPQLENTVTDLEIALAGATTQDELKKRTADVLALKEEKKAGLTREHLDRLNGAWKEANERLKAQKEE